MFRLIILMALLAGLPAKAAPADTVAVAVAANFTEVMEALSEGFKERTGHSLRISFGSTGKLYAQIANGAPFDVFLAADQARPLRLEKEGLAVPGTRFTYAEGVLVLWSPDKTVVTGQPKKLLESAEFRHLAIANPDLAPYGRAAYETLKGLGLWSSLAPKLVRGQNIGQAFQFVATGNAELGFVALSQVMSPRNTAPGSRWEVPSPQHGPIQQDAVLLKRGDDNAAARAFLRFLRSPDSLRIIHAFGYRVSAD